MLLVLGIVSMMMVWIVWRDWRVVSVLDMGLGCIHDTGVSSIALRMGEHEREKVRNRGKKELI